ncbi:MAG: PqqD family protein [Ktedonobacteraceae bacterium]
MQQMLQRNTKVLWRELDGEAVLLDPKAGCSYNLNHIGTIIWKMLDGNHTSELIASAICESYEVEYEQALHDVEDIIAELNQHELLNESLSPSSPTLA